MNRKKKNKVFLLLILLLGITIGFALLSTTLKINGNAKITKNTWGVYWSSVGDEDGVVPTIVPNITSEDENHPNNIVSFGLTLDKPGDFYEFQVDAVNDGTIDAMLSVITTNITSEGSVTTLPDYIKYSVTYADGMIPKEKHLLAKNTRERYKIRIEFLKSITNEELENIPDEGLNYDIEMNLPYIQADDTAKPRSVYEITRQNPGTITKGDEVCMGIDVKDECFYVLDNDGENIKLLPKYNVDITDVSSDTLKQATSLNTGGVTAFSSSNWWNGHTGTGNDWQNQYAVVGQPNVYDERSYMYSYSQKYKKYLEDIGMEINDVRLVDYYEMVKACFGSEDAMTSEWSKDCEGPTWLQGYYWIASAYNYDSVWKMNGTRLWCNMYNYNGNHFRPVVLVSSSNLV